MDVASITQSPLPYRKKQIVIWIHSSFSVVLSSFVVEMATIESDDGLFNSFDVLKDISNVSFS